MAEKLWEGDDRRGLYNRREGERREKVGSWKTGGRRKQGSTRRKFKEGGGYDRRDTHREVARKIRARRRLGLAATVVINRVIPEEPIYDDWAAVYREETASPSNDSVMVEEKDDFYDKLFRRSENVGETYGWSQRKEYLLLQRHGYNLD